MAALNRGNRVGWGNHGGVAPTMSLGDVVHRFKTMATKRYADGVRRAGWPPFKGRLWQRNYYEHIIADDDALDCIRRYIAENPARWETDRDNPAAVAPDMRDPWRAGPGDGVRGGGFV